MFPPLELLVGKSCRLHRTKVKNHRDRTGRSEQEAGRVQIRPPLTVTHSQQETSAVPAREEREKIPREEDQSMASQFTVGQVKWNKPVMLIPENIHDLSADRAPV